MFLRGRAPSSTAAFWQLLITVAVLVVLWILPGWSSGMHDSDQAAVLGDAWKIATGGTREAGEFYNYDKLFFSQWLLAGVFWLMRQAGLTDIVLAGNLCSSLLVSAAVIFVQVGARFHWRSYAAFLSTLLAPAFLLHAPFMAPAFFSSCFLLLLHGILEHSRGRRKFRRLVAISLLVFAAVGARGDAILALPFVLWLNIPRGGEIWRAWRLRWIHAVAIGVLGAIIVSKCVQEDRAFYSHDPALNLKVLAAYAIFGIGGALPLLGWIWLRAGGFLFRQSSRSRIGWVVGAALLALPFGFYALQLFSTRYWVLGLTTLLIFIASRRGKVLLESDFAQEVNRAIIAIGIVTAIVPLGIGVVVPSLRQLPRPVIHNATVFPSADGLIPMGAYVAHHFARLDTATGGARDHSQAVWLAAQQAAFVSGANGRVPTLVTPMYSILRLAMLVRGQEPRAFKQYEIPPTCYADTRSIIKAARPLVPKDEVREDLGRHIAVSTITSVSPAFRGIRIQRLDSRVGPVMSRPVWDVLRGIFAGDDFWPREGNEVWNANGTLHSQLGRGTTIVILSSKPFELVLAGHDASVRNVASAPDSTFPEWQVVVLNGRATDVASVRPAGKELPDAPFFSAEAILPDYMSQYRSGR